MVKHVSNMHPLGSVCITRNKGVGRTEEKEGSERKGIRRKEILKKINLQHVWYTLHILETSTVTYLKLFLFCTLTGQPGFGIPGPPGLPGLSGIP